MKNFVSFRITAAACYYFAIVSHFGPFRYSWVPAAVIVLLIFAASFAAVRLNHPALRLVVMLIPFAGLAFCGRDVIMLSGCAVPLVYSAAAVASGAYAIEAWRYRRIYMPLASLTPMWAITSFLPIVGNKTTKPMVVLFLLLGILALRACRTGSVKSFRWQSGNCLFFIIPVVVAAAIGCGIGFALPYISYIITPIAGLFGLFVYGYNYVMSSVFRYNMSEPQVSPSPTPEPTEVVEPVIPGGATDVKPHGIAVELPKLDMPWAVVAVIIFAAILIVALILLLKHKRSSRDIYKDDLTFSVGEEEEVPGFRRAKKHKRRTNSGEIRAIYAQYLTYLRTWGVKLKSSNTSSEVSDEAQKKLLKVTDEELRAIYIRARYGDPASITKEDVEKARAAYAILTDYDSVRKSAGYAGQTWEYKGNNE